MARTNQKLGKDTGTGNNIDVKDPSASICSSQTRHPLDHLHRRRKSCT